MKIEYDKIADVIYVCLKKEKRRAFWFFINRVL